MQIKKIVARTLKDAMAEMKEQLGSSAIVLNSKVIEADPEIGREKMFEITAGVEEDVPVPTPAIEESQKPVIKSSSTFESELKKLTDKIYGSKHEQKGVDSGKTVKLPIDLPSIDSTIGDAVPKAKNIRVKKTVKAGDIKKLDPALRDDIEAVLTHREIDSSLGKIIIDQLNKYSAFLNSDNLDSYVISTLASMIPTSPFEVDKKNGQPKIVSLVGPTGVGKTTCIAKLAVISKILHNLDIGLISIDTYRLGALDQLKIFAEVSNIDFLIAYEPSDLPKLVSKLKNKDLIFIDTVGRSQNKPTQLKGIKDFLDAVSTDEVYLVLSATNTTKNLIDVATKFQVLNYDGLVFTKIDEAVSHGNLFNLINRIETPVKYLTNGQVIPDDIIAADPDFIANLVYSGKVIL